MEDNPLKDLVALHRFFAEHNIDDEIEDVSQSTPFERGLYRIQQAGHRALRQLRETLPMDRGRVKSSKSFSSS